MAISISLALLVPRVRMMNTLRMRTRDDHVDDVSLHTYIHTYIHKYSDFLVVLISVGLASARPNYLTVYICLTIIGVYRP